MAEPVNELLDRLLDRRYEDTAKSVLRAVGSATDSARVRAALADFEAEAERLRKLGLPLQPDNPVLRNLTAEVDAAMRQAARAVDAGADPLVNGALSAAEQLQTALPAAMGVPASVLVGWNVVSAEALREIVTFQNNPAWAARLAQYTGAPTQLINNIVLRGFAAGQNPLRTAADIARATSALPRAQANIMLRTLYLQSYRRAAAFSQAANQRMIRRVRRMATLDNRVCMVCVSLHGTEIEAGEALELHEQDRCVSVVEVVGASIPFGPTGEEWFSGLAPEWQRYVAGPGFWEAWKDGAVQLGDVVGRYEDDLYGTMLRQRGLSEILGPESAAVYHRQAQRWYGETSRLSLFPHP